MGPTHTGSLHSVAEYPTSKPPDPRECLLIPRPSKQSDCPCSSDLTTTRGGRAHLASRGPQVSGVPRPATRQADHALAVPCGAGVWAPVSHDPQDTQRGAAC